MAIVTKCIILHTRPGKDYQKNTNNYNLLLTTILLLENISAIIIVKCSSIVAMMLIADAPHCGSIPNDWCSNFDKWTRVQKLTTSAWFWIADGPTLSLLHKKCLQGRWTLSFVVFLSTFCHLPGMTMAAESAFWGNPPPPPPPASGRWGKRHQAGKSSWPPEYSRFEQHQTALPTSMLLIKWAKQSQSNNKSNPPALRPLSWCTCSRVQA